MTLKQISVFVENKPGKLQLLTDVLAKNNINMRALSLAETSEFGIVRIIVDDIEAASAILAQEGFIYTVAKVLGVAIPDEPGGLNRVLHMLSESGINVEYMYSYAEADGHAKIVFKTSAVDKAVALLKEAGAKLL